MAKKTPLARTINTVITIGLAGAAGAAVVEQLRRSPEERTWQGTVLGMPYDFRTPTPERLRASIWNKDTSKILVPHAFGIGWSINFYPLVHPKPVLE